MKFIFVGPSNSGKTTLSQRLAKKYDLVRIEMNFNIRGDELNFYIKADGLSKYQFIRNLSLSMKKSVEEIEQELIKKIISGYNFDILELRSNEYLSHTIETLKRFDSEIVLIFCRCSQKTISERNLLSAKRRQPNELLAKEFFYDENCFIALSRKLNISFFSISTENRTAEESFEGLITVLELAGIEIA